MNADVGQVFRPHSPFGFNPIRERDAAFPAQSRLAQGHAGGRAESKRRRQIIKEFSHRFSRRAESLPVDQLLCGREEVEEVERLAVSGK
jgi:hypothetical protein